ncbi:MAG: Gfo/Idh/MocA family oxidoreductase [bacterium]|nr:Gfo/Idh/MocA family oxidoreductase [bacterium]
MVTNSAPTKIGIIGAGNIAGPYAKDFKTYDNLALVGVADVDPARAEKFAAEHETRAYASLDDLLADSSVELVVNLTTHTAHKSVSEAALNAGKHVYSEKPLATTYEDAAFLVDLAAQKGLRLGCSPFTLMGEAQQTVWKLLREGRTGKIRVVYAEVNWARIESWHPEPQSFYDIGPLFDVGVYPLTILVSIFGPARLVSSYGTVVYPDRVSKHGVPFHITTPDFGVTMVEMADGTVVRLTTNFYVGHHNKQTGLEFHGDLGSVYLKAWQDFDSLVEFSEFGNDKKYAAVDLVRTPTARTPWGRGVWEMVTAIQENRPHRFTGEMAAHVTDILASAQRSMQEGRPVDVASTFTPPAPMEWAE